MFSKKRESFYGHIMAIILPTKTKLISWHSSITFIVVLYSPAAAAAKSLQSCPTLCDPIDGSPPGSPVPGILQARTLEWVAISFSNAWKWKVKVKSLSHVRLLATPWTAAPGSSIHAKCKSPWGQDPSWIQFAFSMLGSNSCIEIGSSIYPAFLWEL